MSDQEAQEPQSNQLESAGLLNQLPPAMEPPLGDYLVKNQLLKADALDLALSYQEENSTPENPISLGKALIDLRLMDRGALEQAVLGLSLSSLKSLEKTNRSLEERIRKRTLDLDQRLGQIWAIEEITQKIGLIDDRQAMLKQAVQLLVDRFGFYLVSIFLIDPAREKAALVEVSGKAPSLNLVERLKVKGFKIAVSSQSTIGYAASNNKVYLAKDLRKERSKLREDLLPETQSEVSLPISMGEMVWGVLDIQLNLPGALDKDFVIGLQTISHQIAASLKNFDLAEATETTLGEVSTLVHASHQVATAGSIQEIQSIAVQTVSALSAPSVVLVADGEALLVGGVSPLLGDPGLKELRLSAGCAEFSDQFSADTSLFMYEFDRGMDCPAFLREIPNRFGWQAAAYLPVRRGEKLEIIFLFGDTQPGKLNEAALQPYVGFAELTSTALDKLSALRTMEKRLDALQTFNTISQAVSFETEIFELYKVIHQEVIRVMGELDFIIATYDPAENTIQIPYMYEGGNYLSFEPFPLGEGLTSILINTREPLMIVENAEEKAAALGAKVVGKPAKSWLGVPLLVGGEVTGAMIVQDLAHEQRFDEDDKQMLSTLASQVAIAIRNTRLLESTQQRAERERKLFEITNKIRLANDMKTILEATATELCDALRAHQARIKVGVQDEGEPIPRSSVE